MLLPSQYFSKIWSIKKLEIAMLRIPPFQIKLRIARKVDDELR